MGIWWSGVSILRICRAASCPDIRGIWISINIKSMLFLCAALPLSSVVASSRCNELTADLLTSSRASALDIWVFFDRLCFSVLAVLICLVCCLLMISIASKPLLAVITWIPSSLNSASSTSKFGRWSSTAKTVTPFQRGSWTPLGALRFCVSSIA